MHHISRLACCLPAIALAVHGPVYGRQTGAAPVPAQEESNTEITVRHDTPSGLVVPRFVSLNSDKTFCRAGPSFAHPVTLTYLRAGLPLLVIAETRDHWRKIRDHEGDSCWIHRSKLSGRKTVLIMTDGLAVRSRPGDGAGLVAYLGKEVIADVTRNTGGQARISAGTVQGWVSVSGLWGMTVNPAFSSSGN